MDKDDNTSPEANRPRQDIPYDKNPITRQEMLDILLRSLYIGGGPFTNQEDSDRWEEYLLSIAQPDWIDALLEIALHPPSDMSSVQEHWDLNLQIHMDSIGEKFPLYALRKVAQSVQEDTARKQVLGALLGMEYEEAPAWCTALVNRSDKLSQADTLQLIEVLKVVGNTGSQNLLHQLGHRV